MRARSQLVRFVLVGVSNTALSYLVYVALVALWLPYPIAGAAGFAAGAVNGYRLNRRWTFRTRDSSRLRLRYLVVQLAGLGATSLLLWLLVADGGVARLVAYGLTIPLVTVATFVANRRWAFREPRSTLVDAERPIAVGDVREPVEHRRVVTG